MKYKELIELIQIRHRLIFKLYSLEYTIIIKDNKCIIYSNIDKDKLKEYNSVDELFKNYKIFGESLKDLINKIEIK